MRLERPTGAEALRRGREKEPPSLSLRESGVPAEKEDRPPLLVVPIGTLRALRSRTYDHIASVSYKFCHCEQAS